MGLTNKKEEQLKKMPNIETQLAKSKDGQFLIHKTVITHVRPMTYYKAILDDASSLATEEVVEEN